MEGGSAHSEQVTITLCFVEQAKANYSHDKEKKKKAVSPFFKNLFLLIPVPLLGQDA